MPVKIRPAYAATAKFLSMFSRSVEEDSEAPKEWKSQVLSATAALIVTLNKNRKISTS